MSWERRRRRERAMQLEAEMDGGSMRQPAFESTDIPREVPEDAAWREEVRAYGEARRTPAPYVAPERVRLADVKARESAYNPVTGRYRDSRQELEARRREHEAFEERMAGSRAKSKAREQSEYNIISNQPYTSGGPRTRAPTTPARARRTANHSDYAFDIVSGTPLSRDHARLSPDVRAGRRAPHAEPEGTPGQWSRRRVPTSEERSFNLFTGEEKPKAATGRQLQERMRRARVGDASGGERRGGKGRTVWRNGQSSASYNIITGSDTVGDMGVRGKGGFGMPYDY